MGTCREGLRAGGEYFAQTRPDRPGLPAKMPFRATNAANWSSIIRIGAKMAVIRRRNRTSSGFEPHSTGWEGSIWGISVKIAALAVPTDCGLQKGKGFPCVF